MSSTTDPKPIEREAPAPSPAPAGEADNAELANLGKIRDILFGAQTRTNDQRLAALEARVQRDGEQAQRRLEELERLIQALQESLSERIKSVRSEAAVQQGNTTTDLRQIALHLKQSLQAIEERIDRERRESRQGLSEQIEAVREAMRLNHEEAMRALDVQGQRLQGSKVDRMALSEILADLSARVSR